jgi:putative SOS response-associated peptidase YedK
MAKYFATLPTPLPTWPRYNVAPSQTVPVVRPAASGRELVAMRWGIVPAWNRGSSMLLINARSETAATKPTFKKALQQRRCLIPATGFYEWRKEGRQKQPYLFRLADGGLFAFAGLWEIGRDKDGKEAEACAILTTEANELVRPAHDRMPVILDPQHYAGWLDPSRTDPAQFAEWLRPYPASAMMAYPVSPLVNNARHEGPDCAEPLATA